MNAENINEKISAWFEPKPDDSSSTIVEGREMFPVYVSSYEGKAWHLVGGRWQPLDYFRSEDANARLLEAMPKVRLELMNDGWSCCCNGAWIVPRTKDRKTAVVLAFCKFAGIAIS